MGSEELISAGAGLVGALVGGGAAILAAALTAGRTEKAAVQEDERDRRGKQESAVRQTQVAAATAIIDDLQTMRDLWSNDSDTARHDRQERLWQLHENARVRALILPAKLRQDLQVLLRSLRFADELGGDAFRAGGFIFLGTYGVARVAFEAGQEQLSRLIAADAEVPWPPDALRLRAAHDDLMQGRKIEYAQEGYEYEAERREFDQRHPRLAGHVHNAKQLRGSQQD